MNGYEIMANTYKKANEEGKLNREDAFKKIRVYEFLADCNEDDLFELIDSAAFNEIIKTFCKKAIRNAHIEEDMESEIMNELRFLFDEKTCKDLMNEQ